VYYITAMDYLNQNTTKSVSFISKEITTFFGTTTNITTLWGC